MTPLRTSALLLGALLTSQPAAAKINLSVSLATDYSHRGLSQTSAGISAQGLLEYGFDSGWYVGVWAGNLEFDYPGDRNYEFDYFLGYNKRVNSRFAFDFTAIRYTYPGQDPKHHYDWQEFIVSAYLGDRWLVSAGVADNWLAQAGPTLFAELGYRHPLPLGLTLDATAGWQALPEPFPDYGYAELGVSRGFGPIDLRAGYAITESAAKDWFGSPANDRWVASISYTL